jgi:prolyl oligopeptidase
MVADFAIAGLEEAPTWFTVFRDKRLPYIPVLCHDRILVLVETASRCSRLIELSADGQELRTLVPEKESPIRQLAITRDRIFVSYLERGVTTIDTWLLNGEPVGTLSLPTGGTIEICTAHGEDEDSFFYSFESFDTPPAIYEHFIQANTSILWHQRGPVGRMKACHVREANVTSKDGTVVPLTLVSREWNETRDHVPVIMTSYGGFGVAMTPRFSVLATIMMELGAIFAIPHIRGGGEFGKAWHDAGRARNRQTSIDDFLATAEWLLEEDITTSNQLAIFGGSHSGLLVGAAMTQRPDLFGAVLCIAPLLDMVRYELFDQAARWRREYGTIEDFADFQALSGYSPYHRVSGGIDYPAVMFVSGDKDDRCNPAHVRKMAALLQERAAQKSPVIVDYSEERGHSPVLPLSVRISALARRIGFLCRNLKISLPDGGSHETPCG